MNLDIKGLKQIVTEWHKSQPSLPNDLIVTVTISLSGSSVTATPMIDTKMSILAIDFFTFDNIKETIDRMGKDTKGAGRCYNALQNAYFNEYEPKNYHGESTMEVFIKEVRLIRLGRQPNIGANSLAVIKKMIIDAGYPPLR